MKGWYRHAKPKGRRFTLIFAFGDYFIAQYNPPSNTWLFYSDDGRLVELEHEQVIWRPLPDPPEGSEIVTKMHCLESDPDFD